MTGSDHPAPSRHSCPSPRDPAHLDRLAPFDAVELQILDLTRLLLSRRSGQLPRHAALPEDVARGVFGAAAAPRLTAGIARMIDEMAQARSATFRYTNPYCPGCAGGITPEEAHFLQVLHHQRRGHRGRAMIEALMICEARPIERLIEVSAELAILTRNLPEPVAAQ